MATRAQLVAAARYEASLVAAGWVRLTTRLSPAAAKALRQLQAHHGTRQRAVEAALLEAADRLKSR